MAFQIVLMFNNFSTLITLVTTINIFKLLCWLGMFTLFGMPASKTSVFEHLHNKHSHTCMAWIAEVVHSPDFPDSLEVHSHYSSKIQGK